MTVLLDARITAAYPGKPDALRDVPIDLEPGEIVGLVGESGSGKSTMALAVLRLLDHKGGKVTGRILFDGRDLMTLSERQMRQVRGREIGLVLQSATSSLNPAMRIGAQLSEAWSAHQPSRREAWKHCAIDLFDRVSLPVEESFFRRYPRELSVGQAQRVLIAMALLHRPKLLIADEPTSALDAITQRGVLQLLRELNRELGTAILFISHDLGAVAGLCSRVSILRRGELVETGPRDRIFHDATHEYTRALCEAVGYSVASTSLSTIME